MAIQYVNSALGATNSTTSFSIALPATQAGDILILEFAHRGTGDGTIGGTSVTTDGLTWTLKHSQLFASSAFSGKMYWTRATGDHAGKTVTGSGLINSCAALVVVYRGCLASSDPLADATIVGEQNASGNETQAQIITNTAGAEVCLVVVNSPDLDVSTGACTSPGALQERAERLSTGGTDSSVSHWSEVKAAAGATGAFTWAQTDGAGGSWAYAIQPAAEPDALTANGITAGTPVVGAATIGQTHILTAVAVLAGAAVLGIPGIGQVHALTADAIAAGAPVLGSPTCEEVAGTDNLIADDLLAGSPILGSPAIGQIHALDATGIVVGAPVVASPTITQIHTLSALGVVAGQPTLGASTIGQIHTLTAAGLLGSAPILGLPTFGQTHVLTAGGIATGTPQLGLPELSESTGYPIDDLMADDLLSGQPTLGTPTIAQIHTLSATGIASGTPVIGAPTLGQIHVGSAAGALAGPLKGPFGGPI